MALPAEDNRPLKCLCLSVVDGLHTHCRLFFVTTFFLVLKSLLVHILHISKDIVLGERVMVDADMDW